MKTHLNAWMLWFFIAAACALAVLLNRPPTPGADLSREKFSVDGALRHIQEIARRSHAVGERDHSRVREYLLAALRETDLEPEVQEGMGIIYQGKNRILAVRARNVIARLPGGGGPAVLLMAHYDTVPEAPGANDDSAGVACLLEILRALKAGRRPEGDIIALFSDGEECGMIGARIFFDKHPLAASVNAVINLEARGSRGIAFMYETGPENLRLIRYFARAAHHPVGNSLTDAIYQRMPNDTDFSIARRRGLKGLNFAYIDGWFTYHQPLDNLDHLDRPTLHHLGSTALESCRALAGRDIGPAGNAVYFNLWRTWMIFYPQPLNWLWTGLALLLLGFTVFVGIHNRRMSFRGILSGFGFTALTGVIATGLLYLVIEVLGRRFGVTVSRLSEMPAFRDRLLPALGLILISVFLVIMGRAARSWSVPSLAIGGMMWWLLGALASLALVPQGHYLFIWPLILSLVGLWLTGYAETPAALSPLRVLGLGLVWLPALIIPLQLFYAAVMAFSISPWLFALPALCGALIIPALTVWRRREYLFAAFSLAAGLIALGVLWFTPDHVSPPRRELVFYFLNADNGEAFLGVTRSEGWSKQVIPNPERIDLPDLFGLSGTVPAKRVPAVQAPPPRITAEEDSAGPEGRGLALHIRSMRSAPSIHLRFPLHNLKSVFLEGRPLRLEIPQKREEDAGPAGSTAYIEILGAGDHGIQMTVEMRGNEPLDIRCSDLSYRLPEDIRLPPETGRVIPRRRMAISRIFSF